MFGHWTTFVRWWIVTSVMVLTAALGIPEVGTRAVQAEPFVIDVEKRGCLPLGVESETGAVPRGPGFAFVDHELAYADGYGLVEAAGVERGPGFDVLDRELARAGGYGLVEDGGVERGAAFDVLDRELARAGGYGLVAMGGVEAGAAFDFLDHELAYAGGYGLCGAALAAR